MFFHHAGKDVVHHQTSWMFGGSSSLRMILVPYFISWLCSWPTPFAEKWPHTWSLEALLLERHRTDGSVHLFFSAFLCNHKGDSSEKMTLPQSSAVQSLHLLQDICQSLIFLFLLVRNGFFSALLDTRPSFKSLRLPVCADEHTSTRCLSNCCTGGASIPQLNQL